MSSVCNSYMCISLCTVTFITKFELQIKLEVGDPNYLKIVEAAPLTISVMLSTCNKSQLSVERSLAPSRERAAAFNSWQTDLLLENRTLRGVKLADNFFTQCDLCMHNR